MEQPLPPNGACLLGSFNLTKYMYRGYLGNTDFNWGKFIGDIPPIIRMMDNVIDETIYPLEAQEKEAKAKRRMGIGITGLANVTDYLGYRYGSPEMLNFTKNVMTVLRDEAYKASVMLAKEKGPFPLFDVAEYDRGEFIQTLPLSIREGIRHFGIRNSHLLSIAPTGTISLFAGNISSGIEPTFAHVQERATIMPEEGRQTWTIYDYAYDQWGVKGVTSGELTAKEHIDVLNLASTLVDSACSKTCNVGDEVTFEQFKDLYLQAYNGGSSGCTTFRPASIATRGEVIRAAKEKGEPVAEGGACFIDPNTGERTCAD